MVDVKNNANETYNCNQESRIRINSSDTMPSTPSSSSDYLTGDDSSDSKAGIPFSLKSVETTLSLSKV